MFSIRCNCSLSNNSSPARGGRKRGLLAPERALAFVEPNRKERTSLPAPSLNYHCRSFRPAPPPPSLLPWQLLLRGGATTWPYMREHRLLHTSLLYNAAQSGERMENGTPVKTWETFGLESFEAHLPLFRTTILSLSSSTDNFAKIFEKFYHGWARTRCSFVIKKKKRSNFIKLRNLAAFERGARVFEEINLLINDIRNKIFRCLIYRSGFISIRLNRSLTSVDSERIS